LQAMRDAEALITQLKAHYQIAPDIDVTWSSRGRASDLGGRYGIHLSTATPMGLTPLTIHEFAHILDFVRTPHAHHHHNQHYYACLLDTLDAAGINRTAHPWEREYATLNGFARHDGYTTRPTVEQQAAWAATQRGVAVGATVTWTSPKHGQMSGTVLSAYPGCRARVQTTRGAWMVPQSWLTGRALTLAA